MGIRPITSADAAIAAELVRLVRERPNDRNDPAPACQEAEILADSGARGKGADRHPLVAIQANGDDDLVVGYGALDVSPEMRRARLVGPVVHPAHRRSGHGARLLAALLEQARASRQRTVGVAIGRDNGAAEALLAAHGFRLKKIQTCLRLDKPLRIPELEMDGVRVQRIGPDDAHGLFAFTRKLVPRTAKQVRSLLKSDDYAALLAYRGDEVVGFGELDMRYGRVAAVEEVDGVPALIRKGLGNVLLARLMGIAFSGGAEALELVVAEDPSDKRVRGYVAAGFEIRAELAGYEIRL